jgi:hypothetical protein
MERGVSTELKRVQALQRGRQRERAQGRLGGLIDFDQIDQGKVISLPLSLSSLSLLSHRFNDDGERPLLDFTSPTTHSFGSQTTNDTSTT